MLISFKKFNQRAITCLPQFIKKVIPGYQVINFHEEFAKGLIEITLEKRASKRKKSEQKKLNQVMEEIQDFYKLELIKEKFLTFFYQKTAEDAQELIVEVKNWIYEEDFGFLKS